MPHSSTMISLNAVYRARHSEPGKLFRLLVREELKRLSGLSGAIEIGKWMQPREFPKTAERELRRVAKQLQENFEDHGGFAAGCAALDRCLRAADGNISYVQEVVRWRIDKRLDEVLGIIKGAKSFQELRSQLKGKKFTRLNPRHSVGRARRRFAKPRKQGYVVLWLTRRDKQFLDKALTRNNPEANPPADPRLRGKLLIRIIRVWSTRNRRKAR